MLWLNESEMEACWWVNTEKKKAESHNAARAHNILCLRVKKNTSVEEHLINQHHILHLHQALFLELTKSFKLPYL